MPDEALLRTRSIEALQCFVKRHRFAGMQAGFVFPQFVGHRRRLPPDHELFAEGNLDRELLAKQVAMQAETGNAQEEISCDMDEPFLEQPRFVCGACKAQLPSEHLLSIHVAEAHDSFFAAQAARKLRVYQCLVEGCRSLLASLQERTQHLTDSHRFPPGFGYGSMHLQRHQGQVRPLPQSKTADASPCSALPQRVRDEADSAATQSHPSITSASECVGQEQTTGCVCAEDIERDDDHSSSVVTAQHATSGGDPHGPSEDSVAPSNYVGEASARESPSIAASQTAAQQSVLDEEHSKNSVQSKQQSRDGEQSRQRAHGPGSDPMDLDELSKGVSRLSVAASDSAIPASFSFGRGRGRGRMSRRRGASQR